MTTTKASLPALPTELLLHVLERVDPLDLHYLATASRFFHDFLNPMSASLWFPLLRLHSPFGSQILRTLQISLPTTLLTPRDLYFAATLHTQVLIWPADPELTKEPQLVHDLPTTARTPFGRAGRVRLATVSTPTQILSGAFGTHVVQANRQLTTLGQVSLFAPWCASTHRKHLYGHFAGIQVKHAFTSRTQLVVQTVEGEWVEITQVPTVACGVAQCTHKISFPAAPEASSGPHASTAGAGVGWCYNVVGSGSAHVVAYAPRTRQLAALRSPAATPMGQVPKRVGDVCFVASTAHHVVVGTSAAVWTARLAGRGCNIAVAAGTWEQVLTSGGDRIVSVSASGTGILVQCASGAWIPVPVSTKRPAAFNDTGWRRERHDRVVYGSNGLVGIIRDGQVSVVQLGLGTDEDVPLFGDGTWLPLRVSLGGAGMTAIAVPLRVGFKQTTL